jgi:hypothetical protein
MAMTFKQWLTAYFDGDYEGEYSGSLAGLEDAWNAAAKAAGAKYLVSNEFRAAFEGGRGKP